MTYETRKLILLLMEIIDALGKRDPALNKELAPIAFKLGEMFAEDEASS